MIALLALLVGFVLGLPVGATLLRDLLDGLMSWPRPLKPRPLPVSRLLTRVEDRRLDIPTCWRKRHRVIDI